jgi:Tfp pilus assembly protein PilF
MDLDDPDTATIALNTAIKIGDGSNADPYILFATLSQRLGNNEEAVYYWQQAWIIEPHNEDIANALRSHGEVPGPTMTGIVDEVE